MAKKKAKIIDVQGHEITILSDAKKGDYISLTDIMKSFDDEYSIYSWMRNKNTVEFIGVWEQLNNPEFKGNEFVTFRNAAGANNFNLTPQKWIKATGAIGMYVKAGRGGGTYAHQDIAVNFCSWLSPTFQLYLIKEFQRLKELEIQDRLEAHEWDIRRTLSKINYTVHTDAIKEKLIPQRISKNKGYVYANEADILNVAVFGMTAKEWRLQNPNEKGNIRDSASHYQLLIISNLEAVNAELIRIGMSQDERLEILNEAAIKQMTSLLTSPSTSKLLKEKGLDE